jgi:transcriptional regulator with XRE-family HTH domain
METTQSVIARLERGRKRPSTHTLERVAAATKTRLTITFEPETVRPGLVSFRMMRVGDAWLPARGRRHDSRARYGDLCRGRVQ